MEKFDSSKTLLIILGASAWPQHEDYKNSSYTDGNNPFQRSVKEIEDYFVNTMKLQEKQVMKELFNSEDPVEKQVEKIESFLQNNNPNDDGDLFIYYVGHGQVVIGDKDYFLYIRNSKKGQPRTFFSMTELFDKFKEHARPKRLYIIVDACYSGVVRRFAPEFINGTVLFCASSESEPAKVKKDSNITTKPAEPTLFTKLLLEVLQKATGVDYQKKQLSCNEVNSLLSKYLEGQEGVPEHQYYVIGKKQGVIGNLGIFPNPNPACRSVEMVRTQLPYSMKDIEGLPQIKWHITTSNKGGVGKTLLSMMLLTHYSSHIPTCIDSNIPVNLPLVIDLNGVNTDLRRLLVIEQNLVRGDQNQILHINLRGERLCIVRVDQEKHPFFLGWLTGDPFRMLNAQSFFKLLATIKGEGIERIREELTRNGNENITIDTVIVDTNYHFCNIFSPDIGDYEIPIADNNKTLREFLWEKDQFFIWFIWVYGQIRNLTLPNQVGGLGLAPDVARMAAVSSYLENYLNGVKKTPGDSPFFHVINPVGLKSQGIDVEFLKESLRFWERQNRRHETTRGEEISQLNGLVKNFPLNQQKLIFARMQNQMVVALNDAIEALEQEATPRNQVQQPNPSSQRLPPVFADREQFSKMLSILKNHLSDTGGRPKNLIPISTYHRQLVSYQDAKHIELIDIDNFEVYLNFRKLLTTATN